MNEVIFLFWLEIQISLQFNDFGIFFEWNRRVCEKALLVKFDQKLYERVGDATRFERSENRVYSLLCDDQVCKSIEFPTLYWLLFADIAYLLYEQ